jgi:YVTN family beta-propeller protein
MKKRTTRRDLLAGFGGATGLAAVADFSLPRSSISSRTDLSVMPPIDGKRTLIVAARDSTSVALVAFDEDRLIGQLDLGIVPRELRVSDGGALVAASDRRSRQLAFADVVARTVRRVDVPSRPTRLVVSPDGTTLASVDDESGEVALLDFKSGSVKLSFQGPPHIRAAVFSTDAALLFVGADSFQGVAAIDLASGRLVATIDCPPVVDLVRAPNGREGFAVTADHEHSILHLDLKSLAILGRLTGRPAAAAFTTGFGRYLLLPDPDAGTVTIASVATLQPGPLLPAAAGVSTAYSAWFDTVALVPSPPARKVLVYDLESGRNAGAITLGGRPGAGTVAPEGDKFFVPVEESGELVVIDTRDRRQIATINVGAGPVRAVIGGGYGICH